MREIKIIVTIRLVAIPPYPLQILQQYCATTFTGINVSYTILEYRFPHKCVIGWYTPLSLPAYHVSTTLSVSYITVGRFLCACLYNIAYNDIRLWPWWSLITHKHSVELVAFLPLGGLDTFIRKLRHSISTNSNHSYFHIPLGLSFTPV